MTLLVLVLAALLAWFLAWSVLVDLPPAVLCAAPLGAASALARRPQERDLLAWLVAVRGRAGRTHLS